MTKASRRKKEEKQTMSKDPWLSWRTGLLVNTAITLVLAIFVGAQVLPVGGLGQAILWGGGAGLSIWLVFFLSYFFNKLFRRR
jgi:uncharacterized membrane-anchored protein